MVWALQCILFIHCNQFIFNWGNSQIKNHFFKLCIHSQIRSDINTTSLILIRKLKSQTFQILPCSSTSQYHFFTLIIHLSHFLCNYTVKSNVNKILSLWDAIKISACNYFRSSFRYVYIIGKCPYTGAHPCIHFLAWL